MLINSNIAKRFFFEKKNDNKNSHLEQLANSYLTMKYETVQGLLFQSTVYTIYYMHYY